MQHISLPTVKPILQGSVSATVTFLIDCTNTVLAAGTAVKKCTFKADTKNPLLLEVQCEVLTAITGTAPVFTVGTSLASANELLGAADITEATPGFYPASNSIGKKRIVADTDIYVKYVTGGGAAGGTANVMITGTPLAPVQ